jgi:PIN domain nuclease of toxin-antitoxin system
LKLLLDSQILVWLAVNSSKLSREARRQIETADELFSSAASIWEPVIKRKRYSAAIDPAALAAGLLAQGAQELPVKVLHTLAVQELADYHQDPFDRILIAQAITEPMFFLTADRLLLRYSELVRQA